MQMCMSLRARGLRAVSFPVEHLHANAPIPPSSPALLPFGSRGSIRFSMDESLTDRWHIDLSQKARCHDVLSPSSE